jgi:hypothetical protein
VDEEEILWMDLLHPGPLVLNPIRKQVAAACKSKTSLGQSLKTHKLYLGIHLVFLKLELF